MNFNLIDVLIAVFFRMSTKFSIKFVRIGDLHISGSALLWFAFFELWAKNLLQSR
jgi:hypothetical protein